MVKGLVLSASRTLAMASLRTASPSQKPGQDNANHAKARRSKDPSEIWLQYYKILSTAERHRNVVRSLLFNSQSLTRKEWAFEMCLNPPETLSSSLTRYLPARSSNSYSSLRNDHHVHTNIASVSRYSTYRIDSSYATATRIRSVICLD